METWEKKLKMGFKNTLEIGFFCDLSMVTRLRLVYYKSPYGIPLQNATKSKWYTDGESPLKVVYHPTVNEIATPLQYKGVAQQWLFSVKKTCARFTPSSKPSFPFQ
jgi:hypothetical protein